MASRWTLLVTGLVVFLGLRFVWQEPRFITADEADTVLGGVDLVAALTDDSGEAATGVVARLKKGFQPHDGNPRVAALPRDASFKRAVVEAPLPRWLAALGVGVLPAGEETPNMTRTASSSALAVALAVVLLVVASRRLRGPRAWLAPACLLVMPGVLDAGTSAGHAATGILVMSVLSLLVGRLVASGRGSIMVGAAVGLAAATHPCGLALAVPVLVAFAAGRRSVEAPDGSANLRLPAAPFSLFVVPIVAAIVLVLVWPNLWNETGKRLGSWLLDWGSSPGARADVAGLAYDPHTDRAAPAWNALVQWVAWIPFPVLGLWLAGVWKATREGAAAAWFPIAALVTLMLVGAMDGGLFGARQSLLPLMWVPTALTAAHGADLLLDLVRERLPRVSRRARAGLAAAALAVPAWQACVPSTWGAASQTGSELRFPLSLALLGAVEAAEPGGIVAVVQGPPEEYGPQLEVARHQLERDIRLGESPQAGWIVSVGEPRDDAAKQLDGLGEVMRDGRAGIRLGLWTRSR